MIYIETVRIKLSDQQIGTGQNGSVEGKGKFRQLDDHYSRDALLVNKTIKALENEGTQLIAFHDHHKA